MSDLSSFINISANTITGSNISTTAGNVSGNNILTVGVVSAAGNVQGNYILGNGSQLTGIASSANTGNVTFNDINIIGTGNLKLQPDPANPSAYLDIFLTGGPDIHIAGNGETVILGTDDFANVTINVDGNVSIQAGNAGGTQTWAFGTDGTLSAPGNIIAANFTTTGSAGNISGANTITANFFIGDGSQLTNLTASYSNANVANYLPTYSGNLSANVLTFTDNTIYSGNTFTSPASNGTLNKFMWKFRDNAVGNDTITLTWNLFDTTAPQWYFSTGTESKVWTLDSETKQLSFSNVGDPITSAVTFGNATANGTGNVNSIELTSTNSNVYVRANNNSWNFDNTGNLTLPTAGHLIVTAGIVGTNSSPAPTLSGFSSVRAQTLSASGNVTANNVSLTGNGFMSFTSGSQLTFGDTPVTNRYYVDATRTDTYTQNGSQSRPFKTISGAQAAIATAISGGLNPEVEPIYIILLSNVTENVTLATNHVYLIGQNGQIHQPIVLAGNITVQPTSGTLTSNHFSISGLEIVGGTNGKAIYVTGTSPLRLSLQDVWITANGTGAGLYQDNTGTGTYTHGGPLKVSHNGSGDVYCFDIRKGTASFDTVETSGATQVGAAGPGATLTFNNSQLDANGDVVVETYGNGVVVVTNSAIKNSAANSFGIKLNAVANVAGTVSVGQSAFNVPTGTGSAVWLDPNTTPGLSGVFAWSGASFYPSTNTTISPTLIPGPLAILVGTQVSPIFYGDITSYALAQDWDLIDNNASALSFDTTGKAGIINLVTTNGAEGVTASGFISAVGNVYGGNLTLSSTTGNIIAHDTLLGGNINVTGYASATGNVYGANFIGNGNTLTNVATKTTGSWTLAAGVNTVSFTVPLNGTYSMWVTGNIPNGIVVWNATVTVTNNNVPVIGQQFSWYYPSPGNALVLTSIPAQIIGTAGAISNATPSVGNTTNVFEFGITNNSGASQIVNYGWTQIG
jgi:hypothetical protein